MRAPEVKSTAPSPVQQITHDAPRVKKFRADLAPSEAASPKSQDGGRQQRAMFADATERHQGNRNLNTELTENGSKQISANSLMSRTAEKLEISLPAERVDRGWKAKVASRENGQGTQNLAAVRSDETGKWKLMPDKMQAAGNRNNVGQSNHIKSSSNRETGRSSSATAISFDSLNADLDALTPSNREKMAREVVEDGVAFIKLSQAARKEMLNAAVNHPNGNDSVGSAAHCIPSGETSKKLTDLANAVFQSVHSQYGFPKVELEPFTLDIKTWGGRASENWHQDKEIYPIIMGVTLSTGENGAPMEYISRNNMKHFEQPELGPGFKGRFKPKASFDANRHVDRVPEGHLAIFVSKKRNQTEPTIGLLHKSPDDSQGRTIGLFRFAPKNQ
ncbi:hypothetical protein [uncultured Tateyamaria sp.]|uniref:hypothetical protein n=1 Tax=uncultured Tateyamaria sp. TaxID=455651 RepID=UPI00260E104D|nr:hypothetical protein [uncultured Tateyamaria sp.]